MDRGKYSGKYSGKYRDIIDLPHHVSAVRPHMTMAERAAQFSPFQALTGYGDAVTETARLTDRRMELDENRIAELDATLQELRDRMACGEHPVLCITRFLPDERKEGGSYITEKAAVKRLDLLEGVLRTEDGAEIPFEDITDIEFAAESAGAIT